MNQNDFNFNTIEEALYALSSGEMIIVCDDQNRENEGDFIMAAEKITAESINFMATHGRGLICVPITQEKAEELNLPLMIPGNTKLSDTPFTISIDYGPNNTTGISASDRSNTIIAMLDPQVRPKDFIRPGHIFPLIANKEGVLKRPGHTEATVDLMIAAKMQPAGVICEIMNEDGSMSRVPDLFKLAKKWNLKIITIEDLVTYRLKKKCFLKSTEEINMPTKQGDFKMRVFSPSYDEKTEVVAIYKGSIENARSLPVRVHSQCFTGDVLGSLKCDCGDQLDSALKYIETKEKGLIIYLQQEGRNIGLTEKVKAYFLQEQGEDTVQANLSLGREEDEREYSLAQQVLKFWNIQSIELMTFNPLKKQQLKDLGVIIDDTISLSHQPNEHNHHYLMTKIHKMGHDEKLITTKH